MILPHINLFTPYIGGVIGGLVLTGIVMPEFAESLTGMPSQPAVVQWIAVPPSKIKGDTKIATRTGNGCGFLCNYILFILIMG